MIARLLQEIRCSGTKDSNELKSVTGQDFSPSAESILSMSMFSDPEIEFLKSQWVCRIATVSPEGWPHNVPVGFVFDGKAFYITSDPGNKKLKNMARNNKVCLIIDVPKSPRRAIMVQGLATLAEHGEEFERITEYISKEKGWKKWKEGEQVAVSIEPTKKLSWGIE